MKYPLAYRDPGQALCFWGGVLLILLAPLVRGGNRYVALIGLEWISLVALFGALIGAIYGEARSWGQGPVRLALWMLVLSPLWVAIFQLVPMPSDWWAQLPGRSFYSDLLGATHMPAVAWRPASLTPQATAGSLLAGLPVAACFVLGLTCSVPQTRLLMRLWAGAAFAQGLLGLAQLQRGRSGRALVVHRLVVQGTCFVERGVVGWWGRGAGDQQQGGGRHQSQAQTGESSQGGDGSETVADHEDFLVETVAGAGVARAGDS